jgi:uncharacterized protein (UPF0332 family)/predicted nucleotidyltransferase
MSTAVTDEQAFLRRIRRAVRAVEPDAEVRLFGSRARGDEHPDSDWDVLVLLDRNVTRERKQRIRSRVYALEGEFDYKQNVQTIVKNRAAWNEPPQVWRPFFKNVQRDTGHDPMPDETNPQHVAREDLERAREALEMGEMGIEAGYLRDAVSRIYYAFSLGARALLALDDLYAKSHSGTKSLFHEHVVKEERVEADLGKLYEDLSTGRNDADYERGAEFDAGEVRAWLDRTETFLETVEARTEDFAE